MVLEIRRSLHFLLDRNDGSKIHLSFYTKEEAKAFAIENVDTLNLNPYLSGLEKECSEKEILEFYLEKKNTQKKKKNRHL